MKTRTEIREIQLKMFQEAHPDFQERVDKAIREIAEKIDAITDYSDTNVTIKVDIYLNPEDNKPNAAANRKLFTTIAKIIESKNLVMNVTGADELSVYWG